MGYNKNWPVELRYDKHKYSGERLIDYKEEQRVINIQIIHKLMTRPEHKILMQIIINYYQLSAETVTLILKTQPQI